MSQFDTLLADLEQIQTEQATLAKSLSDGGDNDGGQVAADDKDKDKDGKDKDGKDKGADGDGDGDKLVKSLGILKLDDGSEVDAIDGTKLVKSLIVRMDKTDGQVAGVMSAMLGTIKSQGEMLKSMSEDLRALGNQGRGRRAVVTVVPKTEGTATLAKSEGDGITAEQFMLKSHAAFDAGKLTGRELNIIDVTLRMGQQVDPALARKVMA